jgi:hypothetical protein
MLHQQEEEEREREREREEREIERERREREREVEEKYNIYFFCATLATWSGRGAIRQNHERVSKIN